MTISEVLSNIWNGTTYVAMVIFVLLAAILILYIMHALYDMLAAIAKKNEVHADVMKKGGSLDSRITNALNILTIINSLIDLELASEAEAHKATKQPFNQLAIDKDVKQLCMFVHSSLDSELFKANNGTILTAAYIEKYITITATTKILTVYSETNKDIAVMLADLKQ